MRLFLIIIIVIFSFPANGQGRVPLKFSDSSLIKENKIVIKNLNEIKESIKAADEEKFIVGVLTISVAFFAVLVSCLTGYLNYKAFKGQSISGFRKNWNNELISVVSEFIITASADYDSLKNGVKPIKFDEDIFELNKIKNIVFFKLKEIEVNDLVIHSAMESIIKQLYLTAKNYNSTNGTEFMQDTTSITEACSELLKQNWKTIKKFN